MRLLHITDTHLFAEAGLRQYGWDTGASLSTVMATGHQLRPDLIVLGGDLAEDRLPATYQFLREQCATVPTLAIPGNHDDPDALAATFGRWPPDGLERGGWQIHGLSSWVQGSEAGWVDEAALAALENALATNSSPAIVFVHHPPLPVGHTAIDAIGLGNGAALMSLLTRFSHVRAVVCGHAHQSVTQRCRHVLVLGTPSTCRQFGPLDGDEFSDARPPGLRIVDLLPGGALRTEVLRLADAQRAAFSPDL